MTERSGDNRSHLRYLRAASKWTVLFASVLRRMLTGFGCCNRKICLGNGLYVKFDIVYLVFVIIRVIAFC